MAFRIVKNSNNVVVLHAIANSTMVIAGNNTVSNVAEGDEIVTGAYITQIQCGSPSGNGAYWVVGRGNTTAANVVAAVDSTAYLDYRAGMPITLDKAANIDVKLVGATAGQGYIMIELKKEH